MNGTQKERGSTMADSEKLGTKNSHFVPQFIQRWYGNNINVFNVKTQEYFPDRNPKSIFSEIGLYPDELESKFNEKMECDASTLLARKILSAKKKVDLTRKDVQLIKRFLMMGMLRTADCIELGTSIRDLFPLHQPFLDPEKRYASELEKKESNVDYWIRTLESILDLQEDFNPLTVREHPNSTFFAFYWTALVTSGYIAIWDAPEGHEFVITDIGMTSEVEKRDNFCGVIEGRKKKLLMALYNTYKESAGNPETKELKLRSVRQILAWQYQFNETFFMFPLSAKRMIVLINPFFKEYQASYELLKDLLPPLSYFTNMDDMRLYQPNQSEKMITDNSPRSLKDKYTYVPIELKPKEIKYCNCLLLDRIHTWLGFGSMECVYQSILEYEKEPYARNDYTNLYRLAHEYANAKKDARSE